MNANFGQEVPLDEYFFLKYGGHTATLFVYFMFWGAEPRIELGAALQQHDALPVGYVATLNILNITGTSKRNTRFHEIRDLGILRKKKRVSKKVN